MRYTIEYVKEYYKKYNCELLSNEYKNVTEKMYFICSCGQKDYINFRAFKYKPRCRNKNHQISNDNINKKRYKSPIFRKNIDIKNLKKKYNNYKCHIIVINMIERDLV